ncbi:MAG TPA: amidohydrolase family protein, partial [Thermoanaerobaculia bacterium]
VVPGLAEMHGHIPPPTSPPQTIESTLFLYLANGITTVRGMLGHDGQLELRRKALAREIDSPTLYLAGPSFNGQSVNSPEEAVAKARKQKSEGWDLLKVHPGLTLEEYDAMARTAREVKIRFGGHVPQDVGLAHAIDMGQETFDHLDGFVEYLEGDKGPVDEGKLAYITQRTVEAGAWVVPTMALWETLLCHADLKALQSYPELRYVPKKQVEQWSAAFQARMANPQFDAAVSRQIVENRMKVLRALNEGGVKILMGTDAPQQFSVPGFSLHRELERMAAAGMTPYDILLSGTVNVGRYFAASDRFGTIEKGSRADLLLLDANPLADIRNVSKIAGVMARGRWYSREAIGKRLAAIAEE